MIDGACYRMIKKKSTASNEYTPFDGITLGTNEDVSRVSPREYMKHHIAYEEKAINDWAV